MAMSSGWFSADFEKCLQNWGYMLSWEKHAYVREGGPNIVLNVSPVDSGRYFLVACWISPLKLIKDISANTTANQNPETFRSVQGQTMTDLIRKVNAALNGRLELTRRGISEDLVSLLPTA